ncbi:molybdate ABC transporter substrate-binding protein [Paraglaciecola mesophila]|uniref:Molybdate ABC transporter substrate-binding protein n=1 Tax=Paraglaciecola mesophila TaxID=197222 RepID=A0ABU9STY5_9ALTE
MSKFSCVLVFIMTACMSMSAVADVKVAVAANFKPTLTLLVEQFMLEHPNTHVSISSASTGVLYAQIERGAPFDLFLSADSERPRRLEQKSLVEKNTRKNYALGQLVLWIKGQSDVAASSLDTLTGRLAIANPKLAPFGLAAEQALQKLEKYEQLKPRIVMGNNVAQTAHYIQTGAAQAGFVALSQVLSITSDAKEYWLLSSHLYSPINQQMAVIKQKSRSEQETKETLALYQFILGTKGQGLIVKSGYQSSEMQTIPRVKPDAQ